MFLKEYTVTELQRNGRAIYEVAKKEPVIIRRQANTDLVMMSKDEYQRLLKRVK